jgi:hypothetical protein
MYKNNIFKLKVIDKLYHFRHRFGKDTGLCPLRIGRKIAQDPLEIQQ